MKMHIISTNKFPECVRTSFYISKDNDASTVLFDTMGGYRFVSLSERDREWQSPLSFNTIEEAQSKLKELHDEKKEIVLKYKLQIVKITHTESIKHEFYQPYRTDNQHKDMRMINLFEPFEKFYASNNTGYTEGQLISLRRNEYCEVGYNDSMINAAFKRYVELVESLPSVK